MSKKRKQLPKIEVTWLDAFDGPTGWVVASEYEPQPVQVISTGYFLKNFMKDHISFCSSYFYDAADRLVVSNPNHVPLGMVQGVQYLGKTS